MSFLRKWSGKDSAVVNNVVNEPVKNEWHNETEGERYYGMENVSNIISEMLKLVECRS